MLKVLFRAMLPILFFTFADDDDLGGGSDSGDDQGETPPDGGQGAVTLEQLQADLTRANARIGALNSESAGRRRKLEEFEKAELERKEAEMTEIESLKAKIEWLEGEKSQSESARVALVIQSAVSNEAGKQGVPADRLGAVPKLVDASAITLDEDGKMVGVEDAVKALLEGSPYLIGDDSAPPAPGLDSGAGGGGRPGRTVTLTNEEKTIARLSDMTEQEAIKRKTEMLGLTFTIDLDKE